jgi:hypothetical protein
VPLYVYITQHSMCSCKRCCIILLLSSTLEQCWKSISSCMPPYAVMSVTQRGTDVAVWVWHVIFRCLIHWSVLAPPLCDVLGMWPVAAFNYYVDGATLLGWVQSGVTASVTQLVMERSALLRTVEVMFDGYSISHMPAASSVRLTSAVVASACRSQLHVWHSYSEHLSQHP